MIYGKKGAELAIEKLIKWIIIIAMIVILFYFLTGIKEVSEAFLSIFN